MAGLEKGKLAIIIGARTEEGRRHIGKVVLLEKFIPCGERAFYGEALYRAFEADGWVVTGDIISHLGRKGVGFYAAKHLMPLEGDTDQFKDEHMPCKTLEKI